MNYYVKDINKLNMLNNQYLEIKKWIFQSNEHHKEFGKCMYSDKPYVDSLDLEKFIDKLYADNFKDMKAMQELNIAQIDKNDWYKKEKIVTYTGTATAYTSPKYSKTIDELIRFVRNTKYEKDAAVNAQRCLDEYKKQISTWELIGLLFKK